MSRHALLLNSDKPQVLRALARRGDLRVRVITRQKYAPLYSRQAGFDTAFVDSFEDLGQVERAAFQLARSGPVDRVIAPTEKSIVAAGWIRTLLGIPGPTVEQSLCCAHKWAMKRRLREHGLPVTDFTQVGSLDAIPAAARALGWPVIVKPVLGSGARATHLLASETDYAARRSAKELDALAGRGLPIQVERLVRLRGEYHCDGVVRDGVIRQAAVARYFTPPLDADASFIGSYLVDQTGPFARRVAGLHAKVVAALGLADAVTHLEVFDTEDGPVVGEVAIRPGGMGIARTWQHAFGVDLWEEFVRAALGEPYLPARPAPQDSLRGWLQLSAANGAAGRAAAIPGVGEVLSPAPAGPGFIEVHFTAAGEGAMRKLSKRLGELAGRRPCGG